MTLWQVIAELESDTTDYFTASRSGRETPSSWVIQKQQLLHPGKFQLRPSQASRQRLKAAATSKTYLKLSDKLDSILVEDTFVEEAVIISDYFELDEIEAAKMLVVSEHLRAEWPSCTRGLVAVLLLFDCRLKIASTLKLLSFQSKDDSATSFFKELIDAGLVDNLVDCLRTANEDSEFEQLESVQGLGSIEHRREVLNLYRQFIRTITQVLIDCALQPGAISDFRPVANALSLYMPPKFDCPMGAPDNVLGLIAVFTANNISSESPSSSCTEALTGSMAWPCPELKAFLRFVVGTSESANEYYLSSELILVRALQFFQHYIVPSEWLESSKFLCDIFSKLFQAFLHRRHEIVQSIIQSNSSSSSGEHDLMLRGESLFAGDQALSEDLVMTTPFRALVDCLKSFYRIAAKISPELVRPFWQGFLPGCKVGAISSTPLLDHTVGRASSMVISLRSFITNSGEDLVSAPDAYTRYVNMLAALVPNEEDEGIGAAVWHFLLQNESAGSDRRRVSLAHLQYTYQHVALLVRQTRGTPSIAANMDAQDSFRFDDCELEALCSSVRLLTKVAKCSAQHRNELYRFLVEPVFTLLTASIPSLLKTDLLGLVTALIFNVQHSIQIWDMIDQSKMLPPLGSTQSFGAGMWSEFGSIENRLRCYPVTTAFLELVAGLLKFAVPVVLTERGILDVVVSFVVDGVLPRIVAGQISSADLGLLGCPAMTILYRLTSHLVNLLGPSADPTSSWSQNQSLLLKHPGLLVYRSMLSANGSLFANCVSFLNMGHSLLFQDAKLPAKIDGLVESTLMTLELLQSCISNSQHFDQLLANCPHVAVDCQTSLVQLLVSVEARRQAATTTAPVNLLPILGFIGNKDAILVEHCLSAISIVSAVLLDPICHSPVYDFLKVDVEVQLRVISRFVNCLEADYTAGLDSYGVASAKRARHAVIQLLSHLASPSFLVQPNIGYMLLGFYYRRPLSTSTLNDIESGYVVKTCIKSVIALLASDVCDAGFEAEALHLIEQLCCNAETVQPVLNMLRMTPSYLMTMLLNRIALSNDGLVYSRNDDIIFVAKKFQGLASLLRCITIDLHLCSAKYLDLRSYTSGLLSTIFSTLCKQTGHSLLLSIVHEVDFVQHGVDTQSLERLSELIKRPYPILLEKIETLTTVSLQDARLRLFDIPKLHAALTNIKIETFNVPVNSRLGGAGASSNEMAILDEAIEDVLRYCSQSNHYTELLFGKLAVIERWKDLVLTLLAFGNVAAVGYEGAVSDFAVDLFVLLVSKLQVEDANPIFFLPTCATLMVLPRSIRPASVDNAAISTILCGIVRIISRETRRIPTGPVCRIYLYGSLLGVATLSDAKSSFYSRFDEFSLKTLIADCLTSSNVRLACLATSLLENFAVGDAISGRTFEEMKTARLCSNIALALQNDLANDQPNLIMVESRQRFLSTVACLSADHALHIVNSNALQGLGHLNFSVLFAAAVESNCRHRLLASFCATVDIFLALFSSLPFNKLVALEAIRFMATNQVVFDQLLLSPISLGSGPTIDASAKAFALTARCLSIIERARDVTSTVNEQESDIVHFKGVLVRGLVLHSDLADFRTSELSRARLCDFVAILAPLSRILECLLMYCSEVMSMSGRSDKRAKFVFGLDPVLSTSSVLRPDLQHLVMMLRHVAAFGADFVRLHDNVLRQKESIDRKSLEEVREIVDSWDFSLNQQVSARRSLIPHMAQRRVASALLDDALLEIGRRIGVLMNCVDMAAILLCGHIEVFLSASSAESDMIGADVTRATFSAIVRAVPEPTIAEIQTGVTSLGTFVGEARAHGFVAGDDAGAELAGALIRRVWQDVVATRHRLSTNSYLI